MARDVNLNVNVNSNEAERNLGSLNSSIADVSSATGLANTGFGKFVSGIKSGVQVGVRSFKTLQGAIAATGIGLLVIAIAAVTAAFQNSEEGQNRFAKILDVIGVVIGNLTDVLARIGDIIIGVFENPQQAIRDFVALIRNQVVNRFTGLLNLLPQLGKAIGQLFEGDFRGAARTATDAVAQVTLGVENFSDKATSAFNRATQAVTGFIEESEREIRLAQQAADLRANTDRLERQQIVRRAELEARIAQLRLQAREEERFSAVERSRFLTEAGELQDQLLQTDLVIARSRAEIITLQNSFSRSNRENLNAEAEAIAEVSRIEAQRFNQARQIQRELNRVNREQQRNEEQAQQEARQREQDERDRRRAHLDELNAIADENYINRLETEAEREEARIELEQQRAQEELDRRLENLELSVEEFEDLQTEIEERARLRREQLNQAHLDRIAKQEQTNANTRAKIAQTLNGVLQGLLGDSLGSQLLGVAIETAINVGLIKINTASAIARNLANAAAPGPPQNIPLLIAARAQNAILTANSATQIAQTLAGGAISAAGTIAGSFQAGGVIPGSSFVGDNLLIRANSRELILTQGDAQELLQRIRGGDLGGNPRQLAQAIGEEFRRNPPRVLVDDIIEGIRVAETANARFTQR